MEKLKDSGESLKRFTYTDKDIANEIYSAMNSTQFLGVSVSTFLNYLAILYSLAECSYNRHQVFKFLTLTQFEAI